MRNKTNALWLIMAVSLGLFTFSLASILVNGFAVYKLYLFALGIINMIAFFMLQKK